MRKYTIWDEFRRMQEQLDSLFNSLVASEPFFRMSSETPLLTSSTPATVETPDYRQPLLDMTETDKEVIATLELPGVDKKDIQVHATEEGIEVKVERKDEKKTEDKKKGLYRIERNYAGFYRFIPVPDGVDINHIKASYKNGVLELKMKKLSSKKKGKQITVE